MDSLCKDNWTLYVWERQLDSVCMRKTTGLCMYEKDKWTLYVWERQMDSVCMRKTTGLCIYEKDKSAVCVTTTGLSMYEKDNWTVYVTYELSILFVFIIRMHRESSCLYIESPVVTVYVTYELSILFVFLIRAPRESSWLMHRECSCLTSRVT